MNVVPPTIRSPTPDEIRNAARAHYMSLSEEEVAVFAEVIAESLSNWERLDELPEPRRERSFAERDPGYRPGRDEDPHNAVVTACRVEGSPDGPLRGYDVGLKDNVAVAGVEMTCGSRVLDGYVPRTDATVVTRLLAAGATITAKLNMESMAISSTGDQSATGPVRNSRDPEYLAGGSSSGSAVAVVTGRVDVAIGTDQAGSIRMPAAINGCVGFKPTFGLVPYTGAVEIAPTIDHVGPMATTVADCARTLDAIAGADPADPRQRGVEAGEYVASLSRETDEFAVGVLEEGFDRQESDARVDETVHEALGAFESACASLSELSVPYHRDGRAIRNAITTEAHAALTRAEGVGHYLDRPYDEDFREAFGRARRVHADDFPINYKLRLILGEYLSEAYLGRYHARAQNLRAELTRAYDQALSEVDVLAMPTVPKVALERRAELTPREYLDRKAATSLNTSPFNVSGHPAISIPCGTVDGLPVGLMLVGRRFDDETVLEAAHAFETQVGWDL